MNGGIIDSVEGLHLVGYFYCVIAYKVWILFHIYLTYMGV